MDDSSVNNGKPLFVASFKLPSSMPLLAISVFFNPSSGPCFLRFLRFRFFLSVKFATPYSLHPTWLQRKTTMSDLVNDKSFTKKNILFQITNLNIKSFIETPLPNNEWLIFDHNQYFVILFLICFASYWSPQESLYFFSYCCFFFCFSIFLSSRCTSKFSTSLFTFSLLLFTSSTFSSVSKSSFKSWKK